MPGQVEEYFQPLDVGERFSFACHRGVACFTECCRQLDLALTPYDVLRLKQRLGLDSRTFLEQYVIIERNEQSPFPVCYLTMVDDGRASCVFVSSGGCTVYADRPGACRCYPVGRGVSRTAEGGLVERFVLIREPHCRGFEQPRELDIETYFHEQELGEYNRYNDALVPLLQHERVRQGFRANQEQQELFILALYDLDRFRRELTAGRLLPGRAVRRGEFLDLPGDDRELLLLGIRFLIHEFFSDHDSAAQMGQHEQDG